MEKLKLNEIQGYFDEKNGQPLFLWMGAHSMRIADIAVELEGIPLLKNENTGEIHLPNKTKLLISHFVKQAKNDGQQGIILKPRMIGSKRYNYGEKFNFFYSQIDYEYVPGLARPWNEGFLTPVFFNLSVLNKYSQNPKYELDLFSETYGSIRQNQEWSIEFGINRNNKVIMWLGDIDGLPETEQYYLRSENVQSDHDIHSEFYDAQIEIKWSEPSRQSSLFHLRKRLKDQAFKAYAIDLYFLDGEVSKVIENLHRPVFWEDRHIGPVIESFNRVFVESLNSKGIKAKIIEHQPTADVKSKGSLKLFEAWLKTVLNLQNAGELTMPFYVLYDFRILTCHLQSTESRRVALASINSRLGLDELNENYELIYDTLIESLSTSYSAITAKLSSIEI